MSWYSMQQDAKQHVKDLYREKARINIATEAQATSIDEAPTSKPSYVLRSIVHFVQSMTTIGRRHRIPQQPVSLNNV